MNFWLILAIKCYFWPITACFRLMRPMCIFFNQNLQFFTFIHFLRRSASSASILAFLDIIFDLLDQFFWKHQNSTIFHPYFHKFNALVYVWYVKNWEKFSLCPKFEFFEKSSVKSNFFLNIYIVPMSNKHGKVKNVLGNLLLITLNFWAVSHYLKWVLAVVLFAKVRGLVMFESPRTRLFWGNVTL